MHVILKKNIHLEDTLQDTELDTQQPEPEPQDPQPPKKIKVKDFAAKIKAKYPEYKDIDDNVLTQKIIQKYPVYKETVDFSQPAESIKKKDEIGSTTSLPPSSPIPSGLSDDKQIPIVDLNKNQYEANEPDNPIDQARYINKLEGDATENVMGNQFVNPNDEGAQYAKQAKEKLKASGFDPDKLAADFKDIPDYAFEQEGLSKNGLLNKYKENPQQYERNIATMQWQTKMNDALAKLPEQEKHSVHESLMKDLNNTDVGDFAQQRRTIQRIVSTINQYGGDDKEDIIKNLGIDLSYKYGYHTNSVSPNDYDDALFKRLGNDNNRLSAYHYLEDFLPNEANKYKAALLDDADIKGNFDAELSKQEANKRLDEIGIQLAKSSAKEKLNPLVAEYTELLNKSKSVGITPQEQARMVELEQQGKPYSDQLDRAQIKEDALTGLYPKASYVDANNFAQELVGQKHTGLDWLAIESGKATENTGKGVWNAVSEPFRSKQNDEIHQAEILGSDALSQNSAYLTQSKQTTKSFKPEVAPELQTQIDAIKKDDSIPYSQKLDNVTTLLLKNGGQWRRTPIEGGETNIGLTSLMYGIGGLAANLAPFMVTEGLTGGGASASALRKFTSAFTSAMATGYQDNLVQSIKNGDPNPYAHAMRVTAINSAALAGAQAPSAIRKLLGTKTAIGGMVNKMTDDEIMAALKETPASLSKFGKSLEAVKNQAAKFGNSALNAFKEGGKITAATTTGQVVNDAIDNDLKAPADYAKQAAIETLKFGIAGTLAGSIGKKYERPSDLSLANIMEAAKNPEGFELSLQEMERHNSITPDEAAQVRKNISDVSDIYKKSPILKNINPNEAREYLYNSLIKKHAKETTSELPTKQAEKLDHEASVADFKNSILIDKPTDNQLETRKTQLEKLLIPEKDAEGKEVPINEKIKKDTEAELEAVNDTIDTRSAQVANDNVKKLSDTKLNQPIEGLDEQGIPNTGNVPPATDISSPQTDNNGKKTEANANNEGRQNVLTEKNAAPEEGAATLKNEKTNEVPIPTEGQEPTAAGINKVSGEAEGDTTSIKNEVTRIRRDNLGLKKEDETMHKSFGATWDKAKAKVDDGFNTQDLVDELIKKPRPVTDVESALLLHHQNTKELELINTNKAINKAVDNDDRVGLQEASIRRARLLDELQDLYDVDKSVGRETARGLSARQMLIDRKYNLVNMMAEKRAANNGEPLSETQTKEVEELHKKVKETQTAFDEYKAKAENDIIDLQKKVLGKSVDKKSAADKLRKWADNIDEKTKGKAFSSVIPITPKMISGAMRLIAEGLDKGKELLDLIKNAIGEIKKDNPEVDEKSLEREINNAVIESGISGKTPETKKVKDLSDIFSGNKLDRTALKLRDANQRAKNEVDISLKREEAKKRGFLGKAQDRFIQWQRAFKLSNPVTMGKLGAAAITRLTMIPVEDLVGTGWNAILPKSLTKGAIGEGGGIGKSYIKETAAAYKNGIIEGMKDSYTILKKGGHGKSELDTVFGKSGHLPPEMIDFFGQLHSATKAPVKRFAFERSLSKRLRRSVANGVDISDPIVQTSIAMDAYKDANRAIFMQDNKVADGWQKMMQYFNKVDPKTGKASTKLIGTTLQWLVPFVKVPTNIASEIGQNVYGVPLGVGKILHGVFTKGLENLSPDEKDSIIRNLKKGTLGFGALTLGYMNPQIFGGYYQGHEKRKDGDAKAGTAKIFGMDIPAWLIESPIFQAMQLGATIRRVKDAKVKGEENGIGEGLWAAAIGLSEKLPMVDQLSRTLTAIHDPKERKYYLDQLAKSTVDPALLQKIAEWTDAADKRKPSDMIETIKTGVPGLREQVPETSGTPHHKK